MTELVGDLRVEFFRDLSLVLHGDAEWSVASERELSGEHFIQDNPQRINVGPMISFFGFGLLRGHVVGVAHSL